MKLQTKTMAPPAKMPGMINGSVIRRKRRMPTPPRLAAAWPSSGSTLANAATALRYRMGYRCSASISTIPQNRPQIFCMPSAPTNGGRIMGNRSPAVSSFLPQKS